MLWMNTTWPGTAATRHTSPSTATRGEMRRRKQLAIKSRGETPNSPCYHPPLTRCVLVCLVIEMSHGLSDLVKPDGEQRERSDGERRSKKQPRCLGDEHLVGLHQQEHARCSGHLIQPTHRQDKMTKLIAPCTAATLTSTARSSGTGRGLLVIARRYTSPQQTLQRNGRTGLSLAIFGRSQGTPYTRATMHVHTQTRALTDWNLSTAAMERNTSKYNRLHGRERTWGSRS